MEIRGFFPEKRRKVASTIYVSGLNNINVDHSLSFGNINTTNNANIDVSASGLILKEANTQYNIQGTIRVWDATPEISLSGNFHEDVTEQFIQIK